MPTTFHYIRYLYVGVCVLHLTCSVVSTNVALLIIDVQNCFLPGGSLAVAQGETVIPVINNIRSQYGDDFKVTVLSQDWHCANHVSFASQHSDKSPYEEITLVYDANGKLCTSSCTAAHNVTQTLWPDHCIQNTPSASFSSELVTSSDDIIIRKGNNCSVDSYSAFFDNGGFSHTELDSELKSRGIDTVVVTGLALDYCVYYTSKDAQNLGYTVYTVLDASKPVASITETTALEDLRQNGVNLIQSSDIGDVFTSTASTVISGLQLLLILFCIKTLLV